MLFVILMSHNEELQFSSLTVCNQSSGSKLSRNVPTKLVCNADTRNCKAWIRRYNQITKSNIVIRILVIV